MSEVLKLLWNALIDMLKTLSNFLVNHLRHIAWLINLITTYGMYLIGQNVFEQRGKFAIGGEIFIPIAGYLAAYFVNYLANKLGKGYSLPVPLKRFTQVEDDGEVSIANDRLQELILYTADLEDWLERKDLL